jgi:hypothetical protein
MNSSAQTPKLPAWIFILTDLALIGAALVIGLASPHPLSTNAILWIVACVGLGALVGLVPLIVIYERRKNETLDERQREIEALGRTVGSSAEQISIAANGLHQIAELALKNLRMAEHLPQKLQEKMAEFQAQLASATDAEKEELERELLALRTSESDRLEASSERIAKSAAEWAKLEAATRQHLTTVQESLARLATDTAKAVTAAHTAAEKALASASTDAARRIGEAGTQAVRSVESARVAAQAELDARAAATAAALIDRVAAELGARLAALGTAAAPATPSTASAAAAPAALPPGDEAPSATDAPAADAPALTPPSVAVDAAPSVTAAAPAAKRPRKPRRDETVAAPAPGAEAASAHAATEPSVAAASSVSPSESPEEPPPIRSAEIPEISPVAPVTAEPFSGHIATAAAGTLAPAAVETAPPPASAIDTAKAPRRRPARAEAADDEPALGLDLADTSSGSVGEGMVTSDGATRLLVTAYIGIGNRLFIRGSGPGLSWEKGAPLQFVSIGKWRWETNDASAPVQFKLYKNDDVLCAALGEQRIEPGHQQEVTAAF